MAAHDSDEKALLRRWVETWKRAGKELEAIHRAELRAVDTREAVRQIFGTGDLPALPPPEPTSGLIEQQMWFRRIYSARTAS